MANAIDTIWAQVGADNNSSGSKAIRPLFSVHYEKDEEALKWLNEVDEITSNAHEARKRVLQNQLDLYKGVHFKDKAYTPRDQVRAQPQKSSRIVENQIYELIEQWVARMTRFKPAVEVSPTNNEYNDRQAAKVADQVLKHLFYVNDFESILAKMERWTRIYGESVLYTYWDDNKGDLQPDWDRSQKEGVRIPINVEGEDGEKLYIDKAVRVGDVCFKVLSPFNYVLDPKDCFEDCDWIRIDSPQYIEEVKAQYPKLAYEITGPLPSSSTEGKDLALSVPSTQIVVSEFYHRRTNELDAGRYFKYVKGCVLENIPHPYSHKKIPVSRITDIDVPQELYGVSFISHLKSLQLMLNNVTALAYQNMAMASQAKWFMQKGTCDVTRLGNAQTVVEYSGAVPPRLETPQTIPPDMFNIRREIKESMQTISGVHGVSRGEPPPGIEAGIALQFLEEQENQRANAAIQKHNALVREASKQALSLAGDFYDEQDGRMLRIVGKNNQYTIKALGNANLSASYDIRVNNTSALPESKAGRIQTLIDLRQTFGDKAVPDKFVINMLETAQPEQFYSHATVNIQKAESENEDLLNGDKVLSPEGFDDHFEHWLVHLKAIQTRSFVDDVPEKIKKRMYDHIETHEMFMWGRGYGPKASDLYAQKLEALENWPLFFNLPGESEDSLPEEDLNTSDYLPPPPQGLAPPSPDMPTPLPQGEPAGVATPTPLPPIQGPEPIPLETR